ncbi:hypothetical protein GCM10022376_21840 [Yimella lutea]
MVSRFGQTTPTPSVTNAPPDQRPIGVDKADRADDAHYNSDQDMDRTLAFWSEAGVVTVKSNRVEVTALGVDFARELVVLVGHD